MVYRINDNHHSFEKNVNVEEIVTQAISHFLKCSRNGGVYESEREIIDIELLANETISITKEKYKIENDDNPLLLFIDECKNMAINGVCVSEEEKIFAEHVIKLYLKIKDPGANMIYTCIPTLHSLYSERTMILQKHHKISAPVARFFDFVDMIFVGATKRTERYDEKSGNYYCIKDEDEITKKTKRMEDLKPYINPSQYQMTLSSCLFKFKKDVQSIEFYIQAFLMLEYGEELDNVYKFLKRFFDEEKMENTIKELAKHSRRGEDFYRFVRKKEKKKITIEDIDTLRFASEDLARSRDNLGEKNIYAIPYEKVTFGFRRDEDNYVSLHTLQFDLSKLLLEDETDRGIIVFTPDDHFAIRNTDSPKKAVIKLESFINKTNLSQDGSVEEDSYIEAIKSDLGHDIIIVSNNAGKISIETHISPVVTDLQRYYLKGLARQLSYIAIIMKLRFYDPDREENIEEVNKCIREIKENLKSQSKECTGKELVLNWLRKKKK